MYCPTVGVNLLGSTGCFSFSSPEMNETNVVEGKGGERLTRMQ